MKAVSKALILLFILTLPFRLFSQVPIEESQYVTTGISPKYFGPYAFPVPQQLDGRIHQGLRVELAGDYTMGYIGGKDNIDRTYAPVFSLNIPLWSDKVSLIISGEFHEWYEDTPATREARRVSEEHPLTGNDSGNLYFGVEVQILKDLRYIPDLAVRAVTLTATGHDFEIARHYDAPGYFLDGSLGKSFYITKNSYLRPSVTGGFVCWQTDRGRQNDARMIGAKLLWASEKLYCSAEYGQYRGWESKYSDESGDRPRVLKAKIGYNIYSQKQGVFTPFVMIQHGLHDWPFTQIRAGLVWHFDLIGLVNHFSSNDL